MLIGKNRLTMKPEAPRVMITLYSYPSLFGVADNNSYGLKVFAFLRLTGLPFAHEHLFDASSAPRGQLPYIVEDGETIGDSETIITHLIRKYGLTIDAALGARERDLSLLVTPVFAVGIRQPRLKLKASTAPPRAFPLRCEIPWLPVRLRVSPGVMSRLHCRDQASPRR